MGSLFRLVAVSLLSGVLPVSLVTAPAPVAVASSPRVVASAGSLAVSPSSATVGSTLTLTGRVPGKVARVVRVQRKTAAGWWTIANRRTTKIGTFRLFTRAPAGVGSVIYRVLAPAVRRPRLAKVATADRTVTVSAATSPVTLRYPSVQIRSRADLWKIADAPADFRAFMGRLIDEARAAIADSPDCFAAVTVDSVRTDGFAMGGVNECGGYMALWGKVAGAWQQIDGTQESWSCAAVRRYSVPDGYATDCYEYDATPWDGWTSSFTFNHPSWGPTTLYAYPGGSYSGSPRLDVIDQYGRGEQVYLDGFDMLDMLQFHSPTMDRTGHLFLDYNPGRYNGVIVLEPTAGGFRSQKLMSSTPRFNFYYAETTDVDGDGVFEIIQYDNDCRPSCAEGTITNKTLFWNGTTYAAR